MPFIDRVFVDAGARWSRRFGFVVFDLTDRMQQLLQDDEGVSRMGRHQQGSIACEAHQGVFELRADETLCRFDGLGGHRKGGERARNDAPDQDGEEFLTDAIGGAAMKLLNMLKDFFVPIMGFHGPPPPIQSDDGGAGKAAGVDEVSQQHRDGAIGGCQADGAEAQRGTSTALRGRQMALEGVRWGEPEDGFDPTTPDKGRDRGEGRSGRTAHNIAVRVVMEGVEEPVTREPAVKEAHAVGG